MSQPLYRITDSNHYTELESIEDLQTADTLPPPPACQSPCQVLEALVEDVGHIHRDVDQLLVNQDLFMTELKRVTGALNRALGIQV